MDFENNTLVEKNKKYAKKKTVVDKIFDGIVVFAAIVAICCLVFFAIFFQAHVIGTSMQPTFNQDITIDTKEQLSKYQDVVVVNRFKKGNQGDIILIQVPDSNIIKRLIAVGGQEVVLKLDSEDDYTYYKYYVDGKKLNENYLGDNYMDMDEEYYNKFKNNMPFVNGSEYFNEETGHNEAKFTVRDGYVFALGDNRKNSSDSLSYGPFKDSQILGTVAMSYKYNENIFICLWRKFISIFG